MEAITLGEIAERIQGIVEGDSSLPVMGVADLMSAREGDLTFLASLKNIDRLQNCKATAVIVPRNILPQKMTIIKVDDPEDAFFGLVPLFRPQSLPYERSIHEYNFIGKDCTIAADVMIGPFSVIGDRTFIDAGSAVYSNVCIGTDVTIGRNCIIYPHVSIYDKTAIGDGVIIHSGTVIGSDGFGYLKKGEHYKKIPQTGRVIIEDDVEIGANCTIDRATLHETRIGKGSKIDNLVQIAHNCTIGPNSVLAAQTGIAGSTKIGKNAVLAGQVGITDHVEITDDVVVGAGSGVSKSIKKPGFYWGFPAKPIEQSRKLEAYSRRLPELFDRVKKLEEKK